MSFISRAIWGGGKVFLSQWDQPAVALSEVRSEVKSGEKLIKYQGSWILQGEIWCWSLLRCKGLRFVETIWALITWIQLDKENWKYINFFYISSHTTLKETLIAKYNSVLPRTLLVRQKSEIYTPKQDDEHPHPFHMGIPPPPLRNLRTALPQTQTFNNNTETFVSA